MEYSAEIQNKLYNISVDSINGQYRVRIDGKTIPVQLQKIGASHVYSFILENESFEFEITPDSSRYYILFQGRTYECKVEDKKLTKIKYLLGRADVIEKKLELRSPMPGLIVEIRVQEGDSVKAGQGIIIVEAMKMENELQCQHDCKIKSICVSEKEPVDQNQVLVEFEYK